MLSKDKPFRLSKCFCFYDDDFRLKILFSKLEALGVYGVALTMSSLLIRI